MRHWRPLLLLIAFAMTVTVLANQERIEAQPAPKSYDPCMTEFHRAQPVSQSTSVTNFAEAGDPNGVGPIVICSINVTVPTSSSFQIVGGTGSACGTGTVAVTGAYAASPPGTNGAATIATVPSGDDMCFKTTGTGAQGAVSYVRYVGKPVASPTQTPTPTPTNTPAPTPT